MFEVGIGAGSQDFENIAALEIADTESFWG